MIPDDQVEEVRARSDIVAVIGEHIPLKRAGKDYRALCPFHEEKTPSFYVVPSKGFYKCFGCGESGDVFSFVMKRMGLDFTEAVKYAGRKAGVEVREVKARPEYQDPNRPLYEANAFAREYYREQLADAEIGRLARGYLKERGIDADTAEGFGIGFAPDEWRGLRTAAARHGIDDAILLDAGLVTTSERSEEPYDRFRSRIIFPIEGLTGKVIAFGGRLFGPGKGAKYLNSPETPVYHKSEELYGLGRARHEIRKEGAVLLVEGYTDVVSLVAHEIPNVVASLGTALTSVQARLLARFASKAFLLYDSDMAGLRATFRAADVLLGAGIHPSVVTLPRGEDPDSVARREGRAALMGYVEDAVDVLDRKLQILTGRDRLSSIDGIRDAVDRLLPTLRATTDPALRDIYISRVAAETGVRRETLEEEIARTPAVPGGGTVPAPQPRVRRVRKPLMGAERQLLQVLVNDRRLIDRASEAVGPEDFVHPANRAIFRALTENPELDRAPEEMEAIAAGRLAALLAGSEEVGHAARVLDDSARRMRGAPLAERARELRETIARELDHERKRQLISELEELHRKKREIDPSHWTPAVRHRPGPGDGTASHQERP
ncbi:MAG: DNA primase [Gammaproteobacteria bacterium]|nr:DNA primase [Gammaproteobacteria bacterium]MDE0651371.1 DNA primase [Gammaproteobacteria bacterium]